MENKNIDLSGEEFVLAQALKYIRKKGYFCAKNITDLDEDDKKNLIGDMYPRDVIDAVGKSKIMDSIGVGYCMSYFDLKEKDNYLKISEWLFEDTQRAINEIGEFKFQKLMDVINYPHQYPELNEIITKLI